MNKLDAALDYAREEYKKYGVNIDEVFTKMDEVAISLHCWQGDDVKGFEKNQTEMSGGISVSGSYPYAATNVTQLRADIEKVFSYLPNKHRLNLHAIYLDTNENVDRNQIEPKHFETWVEWAKENEVALDFNPTLFSHPMADDGLTLSHPDPQVRQFWIEHVKRSRKIAAYFGEELNQTCLNNIWIPDGMKDVPGNKMNLRRRLKESLDEIFEEEYPSEYLDDAMESKLFGIGSESFVVGSNEFYSNYALQNNKLVLLDSGHFHPTEVIADKISSNLLFSEKVALHISRPVRWDSDHVVKLESDVIDIAKELVHNDLLDRAYIGLDFFDASINRILAWTIGARNVLKAFLLASLMPYEKLAKLQDDMDYSQIMLELENAKFMPFSIVWDAYCEQKGVLKDSELYEDIMNYENEIKEERV